MLKQRQATSTKQAPKKPTARASLSPSRDDLAATRAALEAALVARKKARRAASDYDPKFVLMSPWEDADMVLAAYRREHPDAGGDIEMIVYAIQEPRDELCTPASWAAGEAWQAEKTAARAAEAAASKPRFDAAELGEARLPDNVLVEPDEVDEPIEPTEAAPVEEPMLRSGGGGFSGSSLVNGGQHGWMGR
jgi:hypothetical protein